MKIIDFFEKHLRDVLETIKTFNNGTITVKRIRFNQSLKSSNRSLINFYWRALKNLVAIDFLEQNGSRKPQSYKLKYPEKEINIAKTLARVMKRRERNLD